MDTLYKITMPDGTPTHQAGFRWDLPRGKRPGKWHKATGDIVVCGNGLHLTTKPYMWYTHMDVVCHEAEGRGDRDGDGTSGDGKIAFREARLLRPVLHPQWWEDTKAFIGTIPDVPFFQRRGDPDPGWKLFPTKSAAWDAARATAWYAAWSAAWSAAWYAARDAAGDAARDAAWSTARADPGDVAGAAAGDAALLARCLIVSDLPGMAEHLTHARDRWEVWTRGYGLLCDVDGVLYVYEKP